jgi:hypothetical protein
VISIGIDPGLSGAVVALGPNEKLSGWYDTPTLAVGKGSKRDYDVRAMADCLHDLSMGEAEICRVWIEKQQAFRKQGVTSTFATGRGFGLWEGIVSALGFS